MNSSIHHHLSIFSLLVFLITTTTTAASSTTFHPKALLLPVFKDSSTQQYLLNITLKTPPTSIPFTLSLSSPFLWLNCNNFHSSTYHPIPCTSPQCSLANSSTTCTTNTCTLSPQNPFTNITTTGHLASDLLRLPSTDGSNPGPIVSVPGFLFSCAPSFLLQGLANGVQGIAGLGFTKISLSSQFSSTFHFPSIFAICLSPTFLGNGVVFFGDGPYVIYSLPDASASLTYTPLLTNPFHPSEYFIGVTSIKIGKLEVPNLDKSLLSINRKGKGGTKISTVQPYTIMQSSIYKAVISFFDVQLKKMTPNVKRVKPFSPFSLCYNTSTMFFTKLGVEVPDIDLVLQSEKVVWTFFTTNSMVTVANGDVTCLGFVDGGMKTETAIVIGGYQLEDNLLQFDLAKSRLGFQYLVLSMSRCSNFNFTSIAERGKSNHVLNL